MIQRNLIVSLAAVGVLSATACAGGGASPWQGGESHSDYRKMMNAQHSASRDGAPTSTADSRVREGDALRGQGELPKAMWRYFQAYKMEPDQALPREKIAYLHLAEEPARSESIFAMIIDEQPERAQAYEGRGVAQLMQGKIDLARASLVTAIDLNPDAWAAHSVMGVVLDHLGDPDQARRHYTIARGLRPHDAGIIGNLGMSYLLTEDYDFARQAFAEATQLDPSDPALQNNLGITLVRLERYTEALAAFRAAGPEQAAQNNMGYACVQAGNYRKAIDHFESALLEDGDHALTVLRNLNEASTLAQESGIDVFGDASSR